MKKYILITRLNYQAVYSYVHSTTIMFVFITFQSITVSLVAWLSKLELKSTQKASSFTHPNTAQLETITIKICQYSSFSNIATYICMYIPLWHSVQLIFPQRVSATFFRPPQPSHPRARRTSFSCVLSPRLRLFLLCSANRSQSVAKSLATAETTVTETFNIYINNSSN